MSIGGDNLQFYPNFALFSTLGGMNLDHDIVEVWKFSENKKKMQMEHFFSPNSVEDQKKKSSSKLEHFFSPISGEDQKKKISSKIEHFFSPFSGEN